ncbi:interferon-related developmental regulator-domain-containing protein [Glomus cerebriforme]|uniref:Interferon-related developmental regulator-domain-containing protein n=1 Tax=Glomus cerebriforme TaxID=658196 RepID=A0A397S841_9GLOM|nr:interferon-related developmental regulator-domain-containing protein [Glomus cerebriforme]
MSQNLRKKAAARASRRASNNAGPTLASILAIGTPMSSRQNTDEEDVWSETSADTLDSWTSTGSRAEDVIIEEGDSWEDEVLQSIDNLEEKRTSTREDALAKLIRLLSHKYAANILNSRRDTLLDMLNRSVKKDKSYKENKLAVKGEGQETMYHDVLSLLKYTITNTVSTEVKSACIKTLALACFIAGSQTEAFELLDFFVEIIITNGKSVNAINDGVTLTSALNAYGLLYAGLWGDSKKVAGMAREEFERVMPAHIKQLESSTMEVRVASGENIALMFETLGIGKVDSTEEWGQEQDDESDEGYFDYNEMGRLTQLLSTLAKDSNRHRGKTERKVQRSAFRDILKTVEDGERVQEKLKFKKQTIYFSTWAKIVELNAFRDVLAEGLHVHFLENELLQDLFNFVPPRTVAVNQGSRPNSAMSFHTAGSDTDSSIASKKVKNKKIKNRKNSKRRGDFLEVG